MAAPTIALRFLAATSIAKLAPFPAIPEFTAFPRRAAVTAIAVVTAVSAIAAVTAVSVTEIPLQRPAEFPRLLAFALALAALQLPHRALRLEIDDVGLRPVAGRDEILVLRAIGLLVLDIIAAEWPPDTARRSVLLSEALCRRDDAQIMLGVLVIVLGHHRVAGRLGIARQLQILLGDMLGIAADLDVRPIAFEHPVNRTTLATAAAARSVLVLTLSHSAIYTRNCDPRP